MANASGRGIGDISTTTGSDMIGLRCPVGETKVVEVSDVQPATVGTIKILSDMLVIPYDTVVSGIYIAGYDIPKLNYNIINGSALPAGEPLAYDSVSDAFVVLDAAVISDIRITGTLLQTTNRAEQAIASEAIIAFDGIGRISNSASDALCRTA